MSVRRVKVGDVLELQRRNVEVEAQTEYTEVGVRSFGRGIFLKPRLKGADLQGKRVFHVQPGDLVVSNVFAWEGAVGVADERHARTIGSHRFMTWTPISESLDPHFVQHYFASDQGIDALRRASPGSAGRNRTLSIANFKALEIPYPSLTEQTQIADHLGKITQGASRLTSSRSIEPHWRAMIEQLAGLQSASSTVSLRAVLKERAGETVLPTNSYPIAGVYSFGKGLLSREPIFGHQTKYKTLTRIERNDVVYSKLGAFEGAVGVVNGAFTGSFVSPEFPVFAISETVNPAFLRYCFVSDSFVEQLGSVTSGVGARQKRVSPTAFLTLQVPDRPLDEQSKISTALDQMTHVLELSNRADALVSALLPAARNRIFGAL